MGVHRQLLLLSNSTIHGGKFFEWAKEDILQFLSKNNASSVLFIPYASISHDEYTRQVRDVLLPWGIHVESVHTSRSPQTAVKNAKAVLIGGGNTFLLLKTLYEKQLLETISHRVLKDGVPYIGSSAGTNVATVSINTTNDMPIVYPPSYKALGLVPFNINPHYLDPDPNSNHMGETREKRIMEYLEVDSNSIVLGLRKGSLLYVDDDNAVLKGRTNARLFMKGKEPQEYAVGSNLSFLLSQNNEL